MGYVRTGDDLENENLKQETIYHAPQDRPLVTEEPRPGAGAREEPSEVKTTNAVFAGGASLEAIGGAGAVVLAIIGLSAHWPMLMVGIATIAIGGALLFQGGAVAARWHQALQRLDRDRYDRGGFEGGIGTEVVGGAAGIVLGILALAGVMPHLLLPIAAIVFGASLLLGGAATPELDKVMPARDRRFGEITHEAIRASGGVMVLAGIAAAVLGILALIHVGPYLTLSLIACLCVGGALLLAGGTLTARFARRFA